jgi:hypothetical protein
VRAIVNSEKFSSFQIKHITFEMMWGETATTHVKV